MSDQNSSSKLRAKIRWGVVGIFGLIFVTATFDMPAHANRVIGKINNTIALGLPTIPEKPFALGLDLQGGTHLEYRAKVDSIDEASRSGAVDGVRDVIERRVNALGVGETNVQTTKVGGDYRVIVDLPGVTDVKKATAMIGETPILEFKEQNNEPARSLTSDEKKQLDQFNATAKKRADLALKEAQRAKDFSAAVKEYSDDQAKIKDNGGYIGFIGEQSPFGQTLFTWLLGSKPGEVAKALIQTPDGWTIAKRGGERDGEKQARASHILICYVGAKGCENARLTKDEAKQKAEEIFKEANAENFADLAKINSSDIGTKDKGGDLGQFPKGAMVPTFESAVFDAKVGQIVGPVETEYGFHVIYKTDEVVPKEFELYRILVRTKTESDILPPPEPWKSTGLSGKQLKHAEVVTDPRTGTVEVSLQFNEEGKNLFGDITTRNVGKQVGIFLDGSPISQPTVNQPILAGQAVISGNFSLNEAKLLATRLNAGALPVPVELISQEHIGAALGADSLSKSLKAGVIAFLVIILFMILYYRLPGLLSAIALALYVSLSLAVLKIFGVVMSLAGIAGFIMSIGVAVDANVLIFERLREELGRGRSLLVAVEEGFLRAWTSIRDSNISTLITCSLLIMFGSSFVKGFAITLSIGVLVSMFSAITVTRILLRFVVPWFDEKANWMFLGSKK